MLVALLLMHSLLCIGLRITLECNGGGAAVDWTVSKSDVALGLPLSELLHNVKTQHPFLFDIPSTEIPSPTNTELFDASTGQPLVSATQLKNGARLFLVPPGQMFIWPFLQAGHRIKPPSLPEDPPGMLLEALSDRPRLFYIHNFLSTEEADFLVSNVMNNGTSHGLPSRSKVAPHTSGKHGAMLDEEKKQKIESAQTDGSAFSPGRTSENTWDRRSPVAEAVIQRGFRILSAPWQQEKKQDDGLQLLRYNRGQLYGSHTDYFPLNSFGDTDFDPLTGTNRFATILLFLADEGVEGGQTAFLKADRLTDAELENISDELRPLLLSHTTPQATVDTLCEDLKQDLIRQGLYSFDTNFSIYEKNRPFVGQDVDLLVRRCHQKLSVKPRKGGAILWYGVTPEWKLDDSSFHAGCPVLSGTKWAANLWIWTKKRFSLAEYENNIKGVLPGNDVHNKLPQNFINLFSSSGKLFWHGFQGKGEKQEMAQIDVQTQVRVQAPVGHHFTFETAEDVYRHIVKGAEDIKMSRSNMGLHEEL